MELTAFFDSEKDAMDAAFKAAVTYEQEEAATASKVFEEAQKAFDAHTRRMSIKGDKAKSKFIETFRSGYGCSCRTEYING